MLWALYALVAMTHLASMLGGAELLQRATQPMLAPVLLAAVLTAAPRLNRATMLIVLALLCAWVGDTLGQVAPGAMREISVVSFGLALICYAVVLAPLMIRRRDPLRLALAIPYAGVVIGLFVACADGAGPMLPLVGLYALAVAVMAYLSAGGNALTWMGGTLFLLSSSLMAMDWFLPGAAIAHSTVWVMASYMLGQALIVAGLIRTMPAHRWSEPCPGSALVIVEG